MVTAQYFYWQGGTLSITILHKQFPWKLQVMQVDLFSTGDFA